MVKGIGLGATVRLTSYPEDLSKGLTPAAGRHQGHGQGRPGRLASQTTRPPTPVSASHISENRVQGAGGWSCLSGSLRFRAVPTAVCLARSSWCAEGQESESIGFDRSTPSDWIAADRVNRREFLMRSSKSALPSSSSRLVLAIFLLVLDLSVVNMATVRAAAGDLDPTFSGDGKVTTDFGATEGAQDLAIQNNGKIVIVGNATTSSEDFAVTRYNADGTLDSSFSDDGKVTTDFFTVPLIPIPGASIFSGSDHAQGVAIQPNGKIVVVGGTATRDNSDFAIARYNMNGELDSTFDGDGKVITDFGGQVESAHDVSIQADGKIVVVGTPYTDFAVARYNPDGSLDSDTDVTPGSSFDNDGKVTTDFGSAEQAFSVALQADGKIVAAGELAYVARGQDFALARYNTDGSLDPTFGGDGKVTVDLGGVEILRAIALQTSGKILAAGVFVSGSTRTSAIVARYNANGTLDGGPEDSTPADSFGNGGIVTTRFGEFGEATDLALQGDGKVVIAGSTSSGPDNFALARFSADGAPDATFGDDGKLTTDFGEGRDDRSDAVAIRGDKIVVAGRSSGDFATAVYFATSVEPPPPKPQDPRLHYLAMGDSYSAGEGLRPYIDGTDTATNSCHRSDAAYSSLLRLPGDSPKTIRDMPVTTATWKFIACSGAKTDNILFSGQHNEDSQIAQLIVRARSGMAPELVTLTIGGNDVGFVPIITYCATHAIETCDEASEWSPWGNGKSLGTYLDSSLEELSSQIKERVVVEIKKSAPDAAVFILGYPQLFRPRSDVDLGDCDLSVVYREGELAFLRALETRVNRVIDLAAQDSGVHFVDTTQGFTGHEICGKDGEWISGIVKPEPTLDPTNRFGYHPVGRGAFHPNREGQEALARQLRLFIDSRSQQNGPKTPHGLPANPEARSSSRSPSAAQIRSRANARAAGSSLESIDSLSVAPAPGDSFVCGLEDVFAVGQELRASGSGFQPGSSVTVRLVSRSLSGQEAAQDAPVGQLSVTGDGTINGLVQIPASTPRRLLAGFDAFGTGQNGAPRLLVAAFQIESSDAPCGSSSLPGGSKSKAQGEKILGLLPRTGWGPQKLLLVGIALLLLGFDLVALVRVRSGSALGHR